MPRGSTDDLAFNDDKSAMLHVAQNWGQAFAVLEPLSCLRIGEDSFENLIPSAGATVLGEHPANEVVEGTCASAVHPVQDKSSWRFGRV